MIYKLYIGSNNKTKKLESKKAIKLASKNFDGFTIYKGIGYWKGNGEKCLIMEIETKGKNNILNLAKVLAQKLEQEAVAVAINNKMQFITA